MARLWFDTEFIDTGSKIHLLSIGVVRDDGATYYAEPSETDLGLASVWVRENVFPHLVRCRKPWSSVGPHAGSVMKPRIEIAVELAEFAGENPEWWAYVGSYDWVVLSQLYGPLTQRPSTWPWQHREIRELFDLAGMGGDPEDWVPQPELQHHALADAQWNRSLWQRIQDWCSDDVELAALILT